MTRRSGPTGWPLLQPMASTYQPHQINSKLTDQQRDATAEGDVPLLARLPPQQSNLRSSKKVAGVPQLGVLRLAEPGGMSYGAALNSRARACSHWYLASLACQEPSAVNPATLS